MMVDKCAAVLGDAIRWEAWKMDLETWRTLVTLTKQDHSVCDDRKLLWLEGGEHMSPWVATAPVEKSGQAEGTQGSSALREGSAMGEFSFFGYCFKMENRACGREDISLSREDQPLQVKEGLLENVQDSVLLKTCQAPHRSTLKSRLHPSAHCRVLDEQPFWKNVALLVSAFDSYHLILRKPASWFMDSAPLCFFPQERTRTWRVPSWQHLDHLQKYRPLVLLPKWKPRRRRCRTRYLLRRRWVLFCAALSRYYERSFI